MVNSQLFLYLNIVIGILFVLYFLLFRGKRHEPTKLNVKANEDFNVEKTINLSHLQSGMYLLKLKGESLDYTQKIIIN